jgi:Flp pilus assembly protein TadD
MEASLQAAKGSSYQEPAEIATIESESSLPYAAYRRQAVRAAHHMDVVLLSNRLANAMHSSNQALVGRLMEELETVQGSDSLFLIRLKAYWQIQQNHLEKARVLLEQVLDQKPDDKESGMNLAVVDMRTGRIASARRRLEQLQHLYPEDNGIAVALQKLHR